jgi:formate dehydrogenase subunit gamma
MNHEAAAVTQCVNAATAAHRDVPGPLLEVLHAVQNELGCVPAEAVPLIADALNLSRAEVHGVVSFYHHFREKPAAQRMHMQLCQAEACLSMGAAEVVGMCRRILGVELGQTRSDGKVTLEPVYCLGLCACAPAALVNGQPEGRLDEQALDYLRNNHKV